MKGVDRVDNLHPKAIWIWNLQLVEMTHEIRLVGRKGCTNKALELLRNGDCRTVGRNPNGHIPGTNNSVEIRKCLIRRENRSAL